MKRKNPPVTTVAQEDPSAAPTRMSLFFPHSGRGQSILIRVPPNAWIVVDVNKGNTEHNHTRDILERHEKLPGFQILALIVTHFHEDHYSGVVDILRLCEEAASRRCTGLKDVLRRLILPCSYKAFRKFLEEQNYDNVRGHLKKFLEAMKALDEPGNPDPIIRPLQAMQYAWKGSNREELQAEGAWCFTFYPANETVIEDFFAARNVLLPPDALADKTRDLLAGENRYAYLLGIGCGSCGDLCFLLTSDLPGRILGGFTNHLRQRALPDVAARQFGASLAIEDLLDPAAPPHHLWPVSGLTVPHHGSGCSPARHEDLDWWLGSWKSPRSQPAFAIVQGGPYSLRANTVQEMAQAGLRIFATSQPESLLSGNKICIDLDGRLPGQPGPAAVSPYRVVHLEAQEMDDDDALAETPCLTIHGGTGGLHRVIARSLFEIRSTPPTLLSHEWTQIYPTDEAL